MLSQLPTLTEDRILSNDVLKINKLYEYFLASEYSQTFFYKEHVASLKYLLGTYSIEEDDLKMAIIETLEKMYSRYFDEVSVFCELVPEEIDSNAYLLNLNIEVTNNSIKNTLNRSVAITNNKIDILKNTNILLYK